MNNCYIDTEAIPIQDKEMSKQKACVAGSVRVSQYRLTTLFTVKQECNNKSRSGAKPQRALFILEKKKKNWLSKITGMGFTVSCLASTYMYEPVENALDKRRLFQPSP